MDSKLTSLEVIGFAIRSEEDAAKFYSHIAQMIENDLVRAKYQHLAKEEVMHRKLLIQHYMDMSGDTEKPPKIPGEPQTAEGGAIPEAISDSLEDLLKLAIEREYKARDFYRQAATSSADLSGKRLLEYLAHVEQGHATMLENEHAAFLENKEWYTGEGSPGMVHLGP